MRKDAKVLFAVGGVLLAVLVVYFVSTGKKKTTSTNPPPVAVVPPEQPVAQPPGPSDTGTGIAGPGDLSATPVGPAEPPKKSPATSEPPALPDKPAGDPVKPEKTLDNPGGGLEAPKPRTSGSVYIVKANQTLSTISLERYGSSKHWIDIQEANPGIKPERLQIGDKLNLPDIAVASRPAGSTGSLASTDEKIGPGYTGVIPPPDLVLASDIQIPTHETHEATSPAAPAPSGAAPVPGQAYHVRPGDSLYKISKLAYHSGKHADAIYEANRAAIGPDKARLKLDMALTIPELTEAPRTTITDTGR
jgi:nucleoid-associated protein YgaU